MTGGDSEGASDPAIDYVLGRLTPEAARLIERRLAEDRRLASEVAFVERVRRVLKENDSATDQAHEFGWNRLRRALDAEGRRPPDSNIQSRTPSLLVRWRMLAAALFMVAAVEAAMLAGFSSSRPAPGYVKASAQAAPCPCLQATFNSAARESEIRRFLLEIQGEIVSGPSALGVYRLRFADEAAAAAGLARARQASQIVSWIGALPDNQGSAEKDDNP
jgi:anti-sigma-K factor RskA